MSLLDLTKNLFKQGAQQVQQRVNPIIQSLDRDKSKAGFQFTTPQFRSNVSNTLRDSAQGYKNAGNYIDRQFQQNIINPLNQGGAGDRRNEFVRSMTSIPRGFIKQAQVPKYQSISKAFDPNYKTIPDFVPQGTGEKIGKFGSSFLTDTIEAINTGQFGAIDQGISSITRNPATQYFVGKTKDVASKKFSSFVQAIKPLRITFKDLQDVTIGRGTKEQLAKYTKLNALKEKGFSVREILKAGEKENPLTNVVDYVELEEGKEGDDITCSICLSEIDDDFTLLQCGHAFCTLCLKAMLVQTSAKCPQCKFSLKNTTFYTPRIKQILNKDFAEMIKKYGTKIAHLVNICKNIIPTDKTIVYCDSPSLIDNLVEILNENEIKAISPNPSTSIMKTVKDFELYHQVLVLSSEFNASGLNIQFAKSIILLQPIRGEYARVRQTENQIIGRLHRIGQNKEVNLIRLIIKDSVESEILRQNKIIDLEFTGSNMKTDYPMTETQVKELDM